MSQVKQVIVIRKDLKMRRGKEIAQGAHASMKWLVDRLEYKAKMLGAHVYHEPAFSDAENAWLEGLFTKVCVYVESEQELLEVFQRATEAGVLVKLITDAGKTEFNGVPTRTCLAIGPDFAEAVDKITGHLRLY